MPTDNGERNIQMNNIPEHAHDKASVSHDNKESMKQQQEHAVRQEKPNK